MKRLGREFEERYPDYFCWLCEMVCVDGRYTDEAYWVLAKALWDTDFVWILERDTNRIEDGLHLRELYFRCGGTDGYDGPCTVLEVLIALADRIDTVLDEVDGENRIPLYFWEMIENLGLRDFTDRYFTNGKPGYDVVLDKAEGGIIDRILEIWMDREFDYDGHGSPFPLQHPREDQRKIELWYQANAYIIERYM